VHKAKEHPRGAAIPQREHPSGKAIPKERSNILDFVDNATYSAMFNTNQFTADRPWFSDPIRAWGQLIGTIKREYDRSPQKAIMFPLTQLLLYSMNPHLGEGRIFNPVHAMFLLGSPGLAGNIPTTIDTLIVGGHSKRVELEERLGITPFHKHVGAGTLGSIMSTGQTVTKTRHELNIYTEDNRYPLKVAVKVENRTQLLFSDSKPGQEYELIENEDLAHIERLNTYDNGPMVSTLLPEKASDAQVGLAEYPWGTLSLMIYDFKTDEVAYFPTSINSFQETLAPNWQLENYIGRVDAVPGYLSTTRTISLGMEFFATSPDDFKAMWRKLNWLSSLVYADFDNRGVRNKTPIIRIKLGDVINNSKGDGMLAIINSLSYDYKGSSNWEIDSDVGIGPKNIAVSMGLTIFHETGKTQDNMVYFHTISTKNGMQGFRKLGSWPSKIMKIRKLTNNPTNETDPDNVPETDDLEAVSDSPKENKPDPETTATLAEGGPTRTV